MLYILVYLMQYDTFLIIDQTRSIKATDCICSARYTQLSSLYRNSKCIFFENEDLVSDMSFVSFYKDFEQSRLNSKNLKFLQENIYFPSMRFLYRKSLFKNVFDQNFFYLSTDFQTFCCTFCDKQDTQLCQENISSTFEQL